MSKKLDQLKVNIERKKIEAVNFKRKFDKKRCGRNQCLLFIARLSVRMYVFFISKVKIVISSESEQLADLVTIFIFIVSQLFQ